MEEEKKDIKKDEIKSIQKKANKIVLITVAIVIAIILIISGVVGIVSNINEKKKQEQLAIEESNKVAVPNLVGMTFQKAKEELMKSELEYVIYPWKVPYDDDIVTSQDPPADTRIAKGEQVKIGLKTQFIIESDTSLTGATFKKKWSELKEEIDKYYDEHYKDSITVTKENKKVSENGNNIEYEILEYYKYRNPTLQESIIGMPVSRDWTAYISATTDNDNIMCLTYTWSNQVGIDEYMTDLPIIFDFVSKEANLRTKLSEFLKNLYDAKEQGKNIGDVNVTGYYKDNIFIFTNGDQKQTNIVICAANEEEVKYFKENGNWRKVTNNQTNTSSNTNSTVVADIQDRIEFFNSYYAWNFHPTDGQMQQMVEFANTTSNLTNDTLADFIIDKGWLPDSETGTTSNNSSSTTNSNNNNSSSSNKNTSSNSNTNQTKKPQPVLNVTVDPYSYLSKEEQNGETKKFNIVIKFNGKVVKSDTITSNGDDYTPPTYENIKVDSESGTLTVEVNGKTIKYTDGSTSVAVSMYLSYDEWQNNSFNFYDITKMMG